MAYTEHTYDAEHEAEPQIPTTRTRPIDIISQGGARAAAAIFHITQLEPRRSRSIVSDKPPLRGRQMSPRNNIMSAGSHIRGDGV
ncbi:hypothetical protein EVAR_49652_1 [Eumeta japonica]|uniref:Uncharacterized protein n=1 Tax=Eumeta variegata TaxID=151549 RepID=A0A4C1YC95_EUMVA|nr:hypothetical protein EVAR_49652_1 [Eumeta japonica]